MVNSGLSGSGYQVLASDIVLCRWARHFTLTVPLSTQVYKWVLANLTPPLPSPPNWGGEGGSRYTPSRFVIPKLGFAM